MNVLRWSFVLNKILIKGERRRRKGQIAKDNNNGEDHLDDALLLPYCSYLLLYRYFRYYDEREG